MRKTFLSSFIIFSVLLGLISFISFPAHAVIYVSDLDDVGIRTWDNDSAGNIPPLTNISGHLKRPMGVAVDANWIYVVNSGNDSIAVFPIDGTAGVAPTRLIQGVNTHLNRVAAIAVDADWIYVANYYSIAIFPKDATGNVAPTRFIQGGNTNLQIACGITVDANWIYAANASGSSITVFPKDATGNVAPTRLIQGASTNLNYPYGIAVDATSIYVVNYYSARIAVFQISATGNVAPTRWIGGSNTNITDPYGVSVDANWIYASSFRHNSIGIFPIDAIGNVAPSRSIESNTNLADPRGVAVDANWIYIADSHNSCIVMFLINGTGDIMPPRLIKGANTQLVQPYGVAVDDNWIYVVDLNRDSVTVFDKLLSGDVAPIRSIKGLQTTLDGPYAIAVDDNWIYVTGYSDSVAVFPINGTGNIAPTWLIQGSSTTLNNPYGITVDDNWMYMVYVDSGSSVAVFPIDGTGDISPSRKIQGGSTTLTNIGGVVVDTNWIYVANGRTNGGGKIVVFPINAEGNVAPARSIKGDLTFLYGPTGIAIDARVVCSHSILPVDRVHGSGAETGSVDVTTPTGCYWTAASNDFWITITTGASGSGNGTVNYSVSANGSTSLRIGTLAIAGQPFKVIQAGAACTYSILPASRSHGSGAETGSVDVTAPTGCSWTATSNNGWITVTSGASGSGNGAVSYSVSANADTSPRTGTLTIAGQTFTVTQDGTIAYSITLTLPSDRASFNACSFYSLPTFAWNATEPFKRYEIQFSSSDAFSSISAKVKTSATGFHLSSAIWKRILLIPGVTGGTVYWKVIGTRADKTQATSNVCSLLIEGADEVEDPQISSTSRESSPTLSWTNHCNKKFKVWFGNDSEFSKKKSFSFSLKSLSDTFSKGLTSSQWSSIRKLVGDAAGATIYWYIESWDGLKRNVKTDVMSFVLTE